MGARKIESLVNGLSPGGSLMREVDDYTRVGWGHKEELMASLIEVVDLQTRYFLSAHGVKRLPKPIRILRPIDERPKKRKATLQEIQGISSNMPVIKVGKEG